MRLFARRLFSLFFILALNSGAFGILPAKVFAAPVTPSGGTVFDWHTFYGGAGSEGAQSVAVDSAGNIIMAAYGDFSWIGPGGQTPLNPHSSSVDMLVVKLDSSGNYLWHTFVGGSGVDYPDDVAVDASGNIFITGYSSATWNGPGATAPITPYTGNSDIVVAKLNSAGAYQWHSFYGGANLDIGQSLAVDSAGNVVIGGYSSTTWNGPGAVAPLHAFASSREMTIIKLNTNGAYQWHTFYGASSSSDEVFGLTIDSADNIILAGYSVLTWNGPGSVAPLNPASTGYNIAVMKLNSAGSYQWHTFYGANGASNDDWAYAVGLDGSDNVLVAGYASASWNGPGSVAPLNAYSGSGNPDLMILKLSSAGAYQWHTFYGSTSIDAAYAVTADGDGDIIVAGFSTAAWSGPGSTAPVNAFTPGAGPLGEEGTILSLSAAGAYQWHSFYGSDNRDFLRGVAVDASGNYIFAGDSPKNWNTVAGQTPLHSHSGTGWDVLAMKFSGALPVLPDLSIDDVSIIEGDSGTSTLSFTVTRTGASASAVGFNYATADDTATVAGSDYVAASGTGTIPSGGATASTTVSVTVNGDAVFENTESFFVNLSAPTNAVITDAQGVGTLTNDDAAPTLAINDVSIVEGNSGTSSLVFTVTRTGLTALPASFTAATADGTAIAPSDYLAALVGSTTIAAGGATGSTTLTATINGDFVTELNETFFVNLSAPGNATIADNQGAGTISNDDTAGISVTESSGSTTVTEGGATDSYSIVLNSQPTSDVTINIAYDPSQVSLNGDADGSYSRVFTTANWNLAQTVTVTAVDDTVVESNPHATSIVQTVGISDPVYSVINPADVAVSIAENDSQQIVFALANSSVAETAGTHVVNARLNLTTNGAPGGSIAADMSANVFLVVGSAELADLSLDTAQVSFPGGSVHNSTLPINLTLVNDRLLEGNETGTLSLGLVGTLGSVSGTHALTLTDDEVGAISYSAASSVTSESAGTYLGAISRLTITGTGNGGAGFASEANVDVAITDSAGSANTPADYARNTATQTFLAGAVSPVDVPVSVSIANDVLIENTESFGLGFGAISGTGNLSASGTHTVSISDNDSAVVAFAANNDSVGEAVGSFSKPVTLTLTANGVGTASLQNAIVVPVGFTEGTATEPEDFTLSSASLSFVAGSTSGASLNATAAIVNDANSEASESFDLTLGNGFATTNITLGRAATTVTITDNDVPGVTVTPSGGTTTVTEGGATDSYTLVLNSQPTADVTITLNAGTQLSAAPTPLTFTSANWNIAQTVTVSAVDDAVAEGSHGGSISHAVTSGDAVYNGILVSSVTATITDNDTAAVTVVESAGSTAVIEGGATDTYTVVLTSQPTANVAIALAVSPQLSTAPSTLTFTAANWNLAQTVTVTATDDSVVEGAHSGSINHSASSGDPNYSAISVAGVNASISDNDSAVVNFAPIAVSQSEGSSPMTFTVSLSNPVASGVTLMLNSANGSAGAADFTPIVGAPVSFAAGSTTAQTINVVINNDALDEANETFGLTLSNLSATGSVTLGAGTATGTIVDDDATPTLSITSPSAPEGNAGSSVLNFVVSLSAISGQDVTFTRATVDGSATTANNDYVAIASGSLSIPAGQSSLTIPVTINGDTAFEGNETFNVNLTGITNATPGTLSGTGTIQEDDQQPTTTTITSDTPDPSVTGQAYTVNVTVAAQTSSPLGTVTISDGSASCGPVTLTSGTSPNSSASCNLTSTTAGAKTLTATYAPASSAFAASTGTTAHQVNAASTAISVVGPTRSRINQPTTFTFALSVNAPGAGSPAGAVTLSSGAATCSVTVPTATPSCALTFSALGARTVTATFAPSNANYTASSAAGAGNAQTLVYAQSDIAVTKTDAVGSYRPGELLVYTVTVRNLGPDTAVNLRVRDNVPAGLSAVTWSCDASGGVVCALTGGSGNLDVTVPSMASGALLNYTFFGNVSGAPSQISNTALVELPADTSVEDPNLANNSATDTDLLDDLFQNGFEDVGVNAAAGSYRLPSAALRSALDEVAVVVYRLSDANGETARVYARVFDGRVQYALAQRDSSGALRLGAWASSSSEPSLRWTARLQAAGWVLEGAELR